MFRSLRRKKKEISEEEDRLLLRYSRRAILSLNGDEGYPYAIPINYLYDEDKEKIYFHGDVVMEEIEKAVIVPHYLK